MPPSSLTVRCGACSGAFRAPAEKAGRRVRCPRCSEPIRLPEGDGVAEPASEKDTSDESVAARGSSDVRERVASRAESSRTQREEVTRVRPRALLVGAVVGLLAGAIVHQVGTRVEGRLVLAFFVAVGATVGASMHFTLPRVARTGFAYTAVGIAAIAGGWFAARAVTSSWVVDGYIDEGHRALLADAEAWSAIDHEEYHEVRRFMIQRGYGDEKTHGFDVRAFRREIVPILDGAVQDPPTLAEFRRDNAPAVDAMEAHVEHQGRLSLWNVLVVLVAPFVGLVGSLSARRGFQRRKTPLERTIEPMRRSAPTARERRARRERTQTSD